MKFLIVVCALVACGLAATHDSKKIARRFAWSKRATCASEYQKLGQIKGTTHTMCQYTPVTSGSVSSSEITTIVDTHNSLRSDPKCSKTAKAMCKVYWDPEIAKIAQYFADACPTYKSGHDKLRNVPGYGIYTGQNLAWGYSSWTAAIQGWFDEVNNFQYGVGSTNGGDVGHYTQVVKDTTCRIGCGYASCSGKKTYVCNYATGQSDYSTPFKTGTPCSSCPNKCSNNLCDCGGQMCYNGGTLDYSTCTCKCPSLYSGSSCETLNCPGPDGSFCGKAQPYGYPASYCTKYSNVPGECPVMCGTCQSDGSAGNSYIPAPATTLVAGSSGTAATAPSGSSQSGSTTGSNTGSTGSNTGSTSSNTGSTGSTGSNTSCATDRDFCATWVKQAWCKYGDNMSLTYNGEKGTPYSFCPHKCGVC